jgi:chromosome segregation ATPase
MRFAKSIKLISLLALSVLLLVTASVSCQAEASYRVTEPELSNMKYYISIIKQEKQNLINDLQASKISLQEAETRRQSLENQLNEALIKYNLLLEERNELETLLKDLKEQFERLKKEAEAKIRKLTIQRNVFVAVSLILGAVAL